MINKKLILLCACAALFSPGVSSAISVAATQYAGVSFTPTCDGTDAQFRITDVTTGGLMVVAAACGTTVTLNDLHSYYVVGRTILGADSSPNPGPVYFYVIAAPPTPTPTPAPNPTPTSSPSPTPSSGNLQAGATINVVKVVINDNGRTKVIADFPLFVNARQVVSGVTNAFAAPALAYSVTETTDATYTQSFSGDCDLGGRIGLNPGDNKFCIITNDDIGVPPVVPLIPPLIDVVKVPSPLALPAGPDLVAYTYTLHNVGTVPVTNITMVGDSCSPILLVSGDTNNDAVLNVNEIWVYHCSTILAETHTNTIVATGWANGLSAVDIASATVVVGIPVVPPLIHVTKIPSPLALTSRGGIITYTQRVTNPGAAPLSNIRLTDDKCAPVRYVYGDTNGDAKLDLTETWIYECQAFLNKTTTNTVIAQGDANGLTARDFAIATVVVTAPSLPDTGTSQTSTPVVMEGSVNVAKSEAIATFSRSLSIGTRGADVALLQTLLIQKGLLVMPSGVPMGYFGTLTRTAIIQYQAMTGLPKVGIFGPLTRAQFISELI